MTEIEEVYYRERMIEGMVESNRLTYQCKTTGQVARLLGMKTRELFRELRERDIMYRDAGLWLLRPEYVGLGLLRYRYIPCYTLEGEFKSNVYPVWTSKGVEFLKRTITEDVN